MPAARPPAPTDPSPRRAASRTRGACTALALLVLALAGCGGDEPEPRRDGTDMPGEALPAPRQAAGNSVTGMPDAPGPGDVPLAGAAPPPLPPDMQAPPLVDANPEAGLLPGTVAAPSIDATMPSEDTGVAEAVAVVDAYYAAIDAGDFDRAYALWADGGSRSGQTPQQFAQGFRDTGRVAVQPGEPGRVEGAAGSRYVEIPVSVTATATDGRVRRSVGAYVLRRAVVDGADADQRAWRIESAELRDLQP